MIRSLFFLIFFNIFPPPSSPFILHLLIPSSFISSSLHPSSPHPFIPPLLIPSSLICLPPRAELSFRRRGAIVWAARSYAFDGPYDSFWQALCIVLIINGLCMSFPRRFRCLARVVSVRMADGHFACGKRPIPPSGRIVDAFSECSGCSFRRGASVLKYVKCGRF